MKGQTGYSPSGSGGDGLEVCSAGLDEVVEDSGPVLPCVPGDLCWGVDFHRHNLGDTAALEDDDKGADPTGLAATLLSSLDIGGDEGIPDVGLWYDVCSGDGESGNGDRNQRRNGAGPKHCYSPTVRLRMVMVAKLDEESA